MSYYYNHVTLVGRLTKEPVLTKISDSLTKVSFTIAVNRGFKKEGGVRDADFIPIVLWGKVAISAQQLLRKSTPVLVWGRVQISSYLDQDQRKWGAEIVAENFQILQTKSAAELLKASKAI